jgi:hypothetical protein
VNDEVEFSVSFPLDSAGFLRRECPNCDREFKWLPKEGIEPPPEEGYCCPYCGERATLDRWFTRGQVRAINAAVDDNIISPALEGVEESLRGLESASGGLISGRMERNARQQPRRLTEQNDMRRIDFSCHPGAPVKVLDDWSAPVHCLICGTEASR